MTEHSAREPLEPPAVDTLRVIAVAGTILLFLAASTGILLWIFLTVVPSTRMPAPAEFPQPQLQSRPSADLQRYLDKQRSELSRYRWANTEHTLVAIPIERAMEIIAQRGAKGYEPIAATPPGSLPLAGPQP